MVPLLFRLGRWGRMGTGACICVAELCSSCWLKDDDPDESDLSIEGAWLSIVISSMTDCVPEWYGAYRTG